MRNFLTFLLLSLLSLPVIAQQVEAGQAKLQYKHQASFAPLLHTRGFGFDYRRGKHLTGTRQFLYEIGVVGMRSPKETKVQNQYFDNSRGYIYGKLNSITVVRPGVGLQNILYSKENKGAVEIRLNYFAGASFAFAKPVYLVILTPTFIPFEYDRTEERYDPNRHFIDNIYGKAPFSRGISEMSVIPGGFAKLALSVEHANDDELIRAIETGVTLDLYPKAVPIMANDQNKPFFLTLYLSLHYGRKWF
jgi:hypothetical protein